MTDQFMLLKNHLYAIYAKNPFVTLLQMEIVELEADRVILSMPVVTDKHTNLHNTAHGGALASLADTAMGMACATKGKKVVTLEMNLSFIRVAECHETITAVATLIHNGSRTMVAETAIFDSKQNLLVKASATFFVTGTFL